MTNFPPWEKMKPGDHPIHKHHDTRWIKRDAGHDVCRPYFKYSTSKWEQSMIDVYDVLFDPLKYLPISLLEIGIYYGESLRYFREYFKHPDTKLVGVDHYVFEEHARPGDNFIKEKGMQEDTVFMNRVCNQYGPFDIIMDDASHDNSVTQDTFRRLWPFVNEGGFYIIEDVGAPVVLPLLNQVVLNHEGKGFISTYSLGFGPEAGAGTIAIIKKTKDTITGLTI